MLERLLDCSDTPCPFLTVYPCTVYYQTSYNGRYRIETVKRLYTRQVPPLVITQLQYQLELLGVDD
jgi:hypothetical protein